MAAGALAPSMVRAVPRGPITVVTGLAQEAAILGGARGLQVLCGRKQRDELDELIPPHCRGLVSFGVAGAVDSTLIVGDVVIGSRVVTAETTYAPDWKWTNAIIRRGIGLMARVYSDANRTEGSDLYGSAAVDMESYAVAEVAQKRGIPFLVVRTISDKGNIPDWILEAVNDDGGMNWSALQYAMQDPEKQEVLMARAQEFDIAIKSLARAWAKLRPEFDFA